MHFLKRLFRTLAMGVVGIGVFSFWIEVCAQIGLGEVDFLCGIGSVILTVYTIELAIKGLDEYRRKQADKQL